MTSTALRLTSRGPIVSLEIPGASIIVLNDLELLNEFYGKRGQIYSGRPTMTMANELMGLNKVHTRKCS